MTIKWRLKSFILENNNIATATDFRKKIIEETGIIISVQNLCNLLNSKPKSIRLSTIEIICLALDCKMSEFFDINGKDKKKFSRKVKKLSCKNTPKIKIAKNAFPNPENYD